MRRLSLLFVASLVLAAPAFAQDMRAPSTGETIAPDERRSPAEMRADRLDALFAQLHRESGPRDALSAEQDIWELWMSYDSPTAEILLQQASRAMNDKANDPALAILNRLTGAFPDFAEAWNKRATLHFLMGNFEASLADIDKVLDLEPRHFGALSGKGLIYQRQKKYSAAISAFEEALSINPNMPSVKEAVQELEKIERGI